MRTESSATIFVSTGNETWARYVIPACHWENSPGANQIASGLLEADSTVVYIPASQPIPDLQPGDYIVKGIVPNEISAIYSIVDMLGEFKGCKITKIDDFRFGSPDLQHVAIRGS